MATNENPPLQHPQLFFNFRGAELRQSFIAHLESALERNGVKVYVDSGELSVGDHVNLPFKGIEGSQIALVIFSERYTESSWCLDELVKIKERVEEGKLVVIPIFYRLDISQVRRLDGEFGFNLWNHVKRTSEFDKLKKWKEALYFVSGKLGLVLTDSDEAMFISRILSNVEKIILTLRDAKSDGNPKEVDSVRTEVKFLGKLGKDDTVLGESNSEVTSNIKENKRGSQSPPQHQVFISFRGAELRNSFISHLVHSLKREGVDVRIDIDMVRKGESLEIHFKRMEDMRIALVVFSSRYSESAWCLNELVKIKELMDQGKLLAIPVFYNVKPSEVKQLKGNFGDKFWNSWRINRDHHIIKWKEALHAVASLSGFCSQEYSCESEIITPIVEKVNEVLQKIMLQEGENASLFPSTEKGKSTTEFHTGKREKETYLNKYHFLGIEQRMEQLEDKLLFDSDETRIIGVVGMPGIGKTTLAMMLYEKWNSKFIRSVPLLDISKNSKDYGLMWLRTTLLEVLLGGKVPASEETTHESLKVELVKTKIFAVLDDVSDKRQLEFLLGDLDWIKKGSKIVITTSDKSSLEGFSDDNYVVPELNDREAFQLFSYHALDDQICSRTDTFLTLSRMFVDYAQGHPRVLNLLGTELRGEDKAHWENVLETVTNNSNMMLQDIWRFYIDQLNEKQKDVFLDIVSFFRSEDEYFVRSILDSGDPNSTNGVSEVNDLANKFLITISGRRVQMNELLYTFGKDLYSTRWLRLWNYEILINDRHSMKKSDANNVRGIFLDMSKLTKSIYLDSSIFFNMHNLRYLKIYNSCCPQQQKADCKLYFPDGLEFPLEEVRYLHWVKFPLEELPPEFRPENLVDLRLPYSKIERVWEGDKDTPLLKWVDLSYSSHLLDLSALSRAENLRRLNLEGCTVLKSLSVEIENMKSLVFLNLRGCVCLSYLPEMNLIPLKTLILSGCVNLKEIQLMSTSLEVLHLDGTAIKELPPSIQMLQKLVLLNLKNCKMLKCLPNCLGELNALEKLILSGCSRLQNLSNVRESMKHLQSLLIDRVGAKEMPNILCLTKSEDQASPDMIVEPTGLSKWPLGISKVSSLQRLSLSGNDFVSLKTDIGKLYNLKWLDVNQCKNLKSIPMLPPRLQYFDAHGCDSLETVANPLAFPVLSDQIHATFNFSNCKKLDKNAKENIISYTRRRSQLMLDELTRYNRGLVLEALIGTCFPGWEVPAWFSYRASGSVLKPKLPPHWSDKRSIGIGLCAVIEFHGYQDQRKRVLVKCHCEIKNEDGSKIKFICTVGGWIEPSNALQKIDSAHVFTGFTSKWDTNSYGQEDDEEKCVCIETSLSFKVTDGVDEIKDCEILRCGFSLIYAPEERGSLWLRMVTAYTACV